MGTWTSAPPEDQATRNALQTFHQELIRAFSDALAGEGLHPRALLITSPHDAGLWLTSTSVVILISNGTATDATSTHYSGDYTNMPEVTDDRLLRDARSMLNWSTAIPITFDRRLLTSTSEREAAFRSLAEREVKALRSRIEDVRRLGIEEAATFISNARARFESGSPAGYNDCKASCRSAIVSLLTRLTGDSDPRDGVRSLAKEGVFGQREEDVMRAIEDLTGALVGLASKKGAHPPLAEASDAQFTLRLTEATFDFIVRSVMEKRSA